MLLKNPIETVISHNIQENYVGRKLPCTLYINLDIQMGLGHKTINLYECFGSLDGVINWKDVTIIVVI